MIYRLLISTVMSSFLVKYSTAKEIKRICASLPGLKRIVPLNFLYQQTICRMMSRYYKYITKVVKKTSDTSIFYALVS